MMTSGTRNGARKTATTSSRTRGTKKPRQSFEKCVRTNAERRYQEWKKSCSGPNISELEAALKALSADDRKELGIGDLSKFSLFETFLTNLIEDQEDLRPILVTQESLARRLDELVREIFGKKTAAIKHAFLEAEFAREKLARLKGGRVEAFFAAEIELEGKELAIARLSHKPQFGQMIEAVLGSLLMFSGGIDGLIANLKKLNKQFTSKSSDKESDGEPSEGVSALVMILRRARASRKS